MTLYSRYNVKLPCDVYDVDTGKRIEQVTHVDTEAGTLICYHYPLIVDHNGDASVFVLHYRSIYPIFAGYPYPCLFHCYGALQ